MNGKTKRYADLIDGVLELAARDLSVKEYRDLVGDVVDAVTLMKDCRKSSAAGPCAYARGHHGPHSWEKQEQRASDALAAYQMASMEEGRIIYTPPSATTDTRRCACGAVLESGQHPLRDCVERERQRAEEAQAKPKPCPVVGCSMDASTHVHGVLAGGAQQQGGVIGVGRQKPPLGPSPFCAVPSCDNPPVKPGVVCCVHLESP